MRKKASDSAPQKGSAVLGVRAFAAISAVEGLKLTPAGHERVHGAASIEHRRDEVLKTYTALKGRK